MEYTKLKNINQYKSESINPAKTPDTVFEMYSVPIYETGHPEYLRGDEIASNKAVVKKNDILLCKINPRINRVWVVADESDKQNIASSEWIVVRNDTYNPDFLAWYFRTPKFQKLMTSEVTGIGGSLTRAQPKCVAEYPVPIMDREEQDIIVDILNKCKFVIDSRKQELSALDDLTKARFVELFGMPLDKSKANMRFTECVEFNPKKTEVKDMQDVEVSFVPMECVGVDGSFTIRENGPVSNYYKGYTYFRDGDVLLAKITPCFENGKAAIAAGCKNGIGFGTTEFHVARPKAGVSNSYWIKYMLKNDSVHDLATINMTGSAGQKRIQTPFFDKLTIYCPPIELQEQFADFVKQVDKSKVAVQKALDETQLLFDSLMQQYFG